MTKGYVADRLLEVRVAHDVSSDQPGLRLFGLSAFLPADDSAFRRFGVSAFRRFGVSAFRLPGDGSKSGYGLARPFLSDLQSCLTTGKPEVKLTFN